VVNRSPTFRTGIAPSEWRVRNLGELRAPAGAPALPLPTSHLRQANYSRVPSRVVQKRL
jgi:hypothetical protein